MSSSKLRLPQLRSRLRRALASGWEEASCSPPRSDPHEIPESQTLNASPTASAEEEFAKLWAFLVEQAGQGRVKAVIRLDSHRFLQLDARYGSLRSKTRSEESYEKMMGGKERRIRVDTHAPLLRTIGLLNADGSLSTRHARKYKQINHFVEICRPLFSLAASGKSQQAELGVLDLGCGNSYLTFVLAQALRDEKRGARLLGIDRQAELIARSQERAQALKFEEMVFRAADIDQAGAAVQEVLGTSPDLLVSLHACDVATDDALALGINFDCQAILSAPCCHAQWASHLKEHPQELPFASLQEQGLLRRAYAEVLTDAMRVQVLAAFGYEVSTLEFVSSDHSAKNLMIRALKKRPADPAQLQALSQRAQNMGLCPALWAQLETKISALPSSD